MMTDSLSISVIKRLFYILIAVAGLCGISQAIVQADADPTADGLTVLEFFSRTGCSHCVEAATGLTRLKEDIPGLVITEYKVDLDDAALARLQQHALAQGMPQTAVPAFFLRGRLYVGYQGEHTLDQLRSLLQGGTAGGHSSSGTCPSSATETEAADQDCDPSPAADQSFSIPGIGRVDALSFGLPALALTLGLIDGFNPCAMWVLLFLLSLLINLKDRKKIALIAGIFVLTSGVVYFALMAAWLNFFLLVGMGRTLQLIIGVVALIVGGIHVKDFFAFQKGISLSIPDKAKPGIYQRVRRIVYADNTAGAIIAVIVLAVLVNLVELLCTAGLPVLFTSTLAQHSLQSFEYYGYLLLYNLAYVFDDGIMVAVAVFTMSKTKLQERGGRILKLVSGVVIAGLGLLLVFKPEWLTW